MDRRALLRIAAATVAIIPATVLAEEQDTPGHVDPVRVRRSGQFNGRQMSYDVIAKVTSVRPVGAKSAAEIFSISYVAAEKERLSPRPVLFAFNGGPGSSAAAIHLSGIAPKRVDFSGSLSGEDLMDIKGVVDSEYSSLDQADLVFIDPPGTGFSPDPAKEFWSSSGDSRAMCDFIRSWLSEHSRWRSPVYIMGESYGTYRAALVVRDLMGGIGSGEMPAVPVAGVLLIGSIVNRTQVTAHISNDIAFTLNVPTMAMVAQAHGRANTELSPEQLKAEMRSFVTERYGPALFAGRRLSTQVRRDIVVFLSQKTGLRADLLERIDMRPTPEVFTAELLRDQGLVVGSYDGRTSSRTPYRADLIAGNPAMTQINPAFAIGFNQYITEDLGIRTDREYRYINFVANEAWVYDEDQNALYSDASNHLANAMITNPHMRLLAQSGLYDLATPYMAAEHSFSQCIFPEDRTFLRTYLSGHMCYVGEEPARLFAQDVRAFLKGTMRATA